MPLPKSATWDEVMAALADSVSAVEGYWSSLPGWPNVPSPRSPGYLALGYGNAQGQHKTRVRLTITGDPYDTAQMTAEANAWADGLKWALNTAYTIDTWYSYNADGDLVQQTLLSAPQVGQRGATTLQSNSFTETITGHGRALAAGLSAGEARTRWFPYACTVPTRGDKSRILASDPNILPVAFQLAVSSIIWADFFGQKAGIRGSVPIQQNAFAQKKRGW